MRSYRSYSEINLRPKTHLSVTPTVYTEPHTRRYGTSIAESWPMAFEDSMARRDWKHDYNLAELEPLLLSLHARVPRWGTQGVLTGENMLTCEARLLQLLFRERRPTVGGGLGRRAAWAGAPATPVVSDLLKQPVARPLHYTRSS
ncbi:unnamed protein product [Lota lota]